MDKNSADQCHREGAAGVTIAKTMAGCLEADAHIVGVEDDEVHR